MSQTKESSFVTSRLHLEAAMKTPRAGASKPCTRP